MDHTCLFFIMCACVWYSIGAVQPVGEPLSSHFQKESVGVLQKFMLKEHRLVWNSLTRSWWEIHQECSLTMLYMIIVLVFLPTCESGKYRSDRDQVERKKGNMLLICLKLRLRLLYAIQGLPSCLAASGSAWNTVNTVAMLKCWSS